MSILRLPPTFSLLLITASLTAVALPTKANPNPSASDSSPRPVDVASGESLQPTSLEAPVLIQAQSEAEEPAAAESTESEVDAAAEAPGAAVDLQVQPRVGVDYTTDGGAYPALGSFEAFAPIWQTEGDALGFVEGRIVLNQDDTTAGGLLLGYRRYNPSVDRIRGGYLGFDLRGTPATTFYQLSSGYESLGRDWDFRINGYLPLGGRDLTASTSLLSTTARFQGNQLLLDNRQLVQGESALGGFDAEAGTRLAHWETGDLQGFGGLYLQGSPDLGNYLGWRLRLAADVTPNFTTGLTLQGDGLFGSRLVFGIGATFPGTRPSGVLPEADQVRARLGESTARLPEIAVRFTATETISSEVVQNPEEEEDYRFQHVRLGSTGGDGTFENPFGTVAAALAATQRDGNDVVYVDGASDVLIPALTIPDQVQLLSQGPQQWLVGLVPMTFPTPSLDGLINQRRIPLYVNADLDTSDDNTAPNRMIVVPLPESGDGSFPRIDGVTLGNRTVLAGFRLENVAGNAITGTNVSNVELRNNTITNPGERGIALTDVGGGVILFDNVVSGAQSNGPTSGQGIVISNSLNQGSENVEVTIAGFQSNGNRVGIELISRGPGGVAAGLPLQMVTLGPSDPANTSSGLSAGSTITNSASNNRDQGILITATAVGGQEVTIQNVNVSNNGGDGVLVTGGDLGGSLTNFQEVQVIDSTISSNNGNGISIVGNERSTQELNFARNAISNNGQIGIVSIANNSALQEFVAKSDLGLLGIGNNIISGNTGGGLSFATSSDDILLLEIAQNNFTGNGASFDMRVSSNGTARTCFIARFNQGAPRIQLNNLSASIFQVGNLANLSSNNGNATVTLSPNPSSFTDVGTQQVCLRQGNP